MEYIQPILMHEIYIHFHVHRSYGYDRSCRDFLQHRARERVNLVTGNVRVF